MKTHLTRGRILALVLIAASSISASGRAAHVQHGDFPKSFLGSWKGGGKSFGAASQTEMRWEQVLDGRFIRLWYRNEWRDAQGKSSAFEGHAYYKVLTSEKYEGRWFDSYGELHPIEATFDGVALTAQWGTPETKMGRTIYRLRNENEIEIVDTARRKDGTWGEFSRVTLQRRPSA